MRLEGQWKQILASAVILGLFGVLGSALVALTWSATEERIAWNQQQAFLRNVHQLLSHEEMDNNLLKDVITVQDPELSDKPITVYRVRKQQQPVALIFSPIDAPGYAAPIRLIIAVRSNGVLGGVRVLSQMETPGLGDKIDENKSDWILSFDGKSLGNPPLSRWKVKKDGGIFDQFTGATITPRSVVKTVKTTLLYFRKHHQELFERPAESKTEPAFH